MNDDRTLAVYYDGNETPTYLLHQHETWRPARVDMSWRIVDERTGRTVDEYHPNPPRRPITPFTTKA